MQGDYNKLLIAPLEIMRLVLNKIYHLEKLPFDGWWRWNTNFFSLYDFPIWRFVEY